MNVLFVKLGAIGDAAMALSVPPALDAVHPGARLTWLCGRTIEPLLRVYPQIHELLVVNERVLFGPSKVAALWELLKLQKRLLGRRFDLVLHGNSDWRYRLLTAVVQSKEDRGWSRTSRRPWPIPGRYHGDEYARLVTQSDSPELRHWSPPTPSLKISQTLRIALQGKSPLIVIAPGGAKNILADSSLRRWPLEHYVALAAELVLKGYRIALTGGDTDRWVAPSFAHIPHVDLIGRTSIPDLLAVYSLAHAVVSHDTSSIHLPRLVATPVIALFGPTMPAQFFPVSAKGQVLWGGAHLACRPCYDGRNYNACHTNACMRSISVSQVLAAVEALRDSRAPTSAATMNDFSPLSLNPHI